MEVQNISGPDVIVNTPAIKESQIQNNETKNTPEENLPVQTVEENKGTSIDTYA